jgi:WD40 repeat protein
VTFNGYKNNIVGLGFMQHNRLLYSGSEDGTLKLWDMRSASMYKDFPKAEEACSYVTILPSEVCFFFLLMTVFIFRNFLLQPINMEW